MPQAKDLTELLASHGESVTSVGLAHSTTLHWKKGVSRPYGSTIKRLAERLGETPEAVYAAIEESRRRHDEQATAPGAA